MKRFELNLSLTSVIVILAAGVLLPVILSTAVGIVTVALANQTGTLVLGILVICFAAAAAGAALVAVVLAGRKNRLARRQADFLANITHELRTPLSAIRLHAQTIASGKLADRPEEVANCTATILRETEWLNLMIDEVLTWRASSKDAMRFDMKVGPVGPAVDSAATRFRNMVAPDEMTFSVDCNSSLRVRHDHKAVSTVVLNLLTNAYKYTRQDKQIGLRLHDNGESVAIEVSDNGIGLSPRDTKRVLQPFCRVDTHLSGESAGVGLGLAIVQELVRRHNGSIEIRSEETKGSTFIVHLPSVPTADDQEDVK
jgi:two-component system phosphate regulon sensor histidine kinase PhoR